MRLYSFRSMYSVVIGIPFMHFFVICLCAFFVQRFLIESYDPQVLILLVIFLGSLIYVDIELYRLKIYHRCFVKFKVDNIGICCYGVCVKSWKIAWNDIRAYGITGYDAKNQPYALIYLSKNAHEENSFKQKILINNQRVVIQIRDDTVVALNQHMPQDIKKRITKAMGQKTDFFCRR